MSTQPGGGIIPCPFDHVPAIDVVVRMANTDAEGGLSQGATCREFRQVRTEGTRKVVRTLPFYKPGHSPQYVGRLCEMGRVRSLVSRTFAVQELRKKKQEKMGE